MMEVWRTNYYMQLINCYMRWFAKTWHQVWVWVPYVINWCQVVPIDNNLQKYCEDAICPSLRWFFTDKEHGKKHLSKSCTCDDFLPRKKTRSFSVKNIFQNHLPVTIFYHVRNFESWFFIDKERVFFLVKMTGTWFWKVFFTKKERVFSW